MRLFEALLVATYVSSCSPAAQEETNAGDTPSVPPHPGSLLVLDGLGYPAPNVSVELQGQVLTTDANGKAELEDLPARYDLVTRVGTRVYAFEGLESRGPTLKLSVIEPSSRSTFSLALSTTLDGYQNVLLDLTVDGEGVEGSRVSGTIDNMSIEWSGSAHATVSVEAFLVDLDPETHAVLRYAGFAQQTWEATDAANEVWQPEFLPVKFGTTTIHVDVQAPQGATSVAATLTRDGGLPGFFVSSQFATSIDFLIPDTRDVRYRVNAQAAVGEGTAFASIADVAPGERVNVTVPATPSAVSPADSASNVNIDTEFTWAPVDDAIYELTFTSADSQFASVHVFTKQPSARLPDTSALGFTLPGGMAFEWLVWSLHGVSLDEQAAGERGSASGHSASRRCYTSSEP